LRRIFGPKRDDIIGDWRKLHNEEVNNICYSPNIITLMKPTTIRWSWHVTRIAKECTICRILIENPEGKKTRKT
jgi:hypothetical protein